MRVACRNHDPGGDRLSMQPSSVAQACLYRVAESMAEIQQRALAALLVLVGGNDLGFVFARALNRVGERPGVARGERIDAVVFLLGAGVVRGGAPPPAARGGGAHRYSVPAMRKTPDRGSGRT